MVWHSDEHVRSVPLFSFLIVYPFTLTVDIRLAKDISLLCSHIFFFPYVSIQFSFIVISNFNDKAVNVEHLILITDWNVILQTKRQHTHKKTVLLFYETILVINLTIQNHRKISWDREEREKKNTGYRIILLIPVRSLCVVTTEEEKNNRKYHT